MEEKQGYSLRIYLIRSRSMGLALLAAILALGLPSIVLASASEYPIATIYLRPEAEVTGTSITLGEIADIESHVEDDTPAALAGLHVGRAPLPGNSRMIATGHIEVRLRQAGIHPSTVVLIPPPGGSIKVTTATQTITASMVTEAVRERIYESIQDGLHVAVEAGAGLPVIAPLGDVEFRMDSLPTKPGSYRVGIGLYVDGQRFRTFQARIELQVAMETDASAQAEDVKMPIFVQAGDSVVIRAQSGTISVETLGIALQNGRLGDLIRVKNAASQREITARVVGDGIVSLELYPKW
ncbi:MAG: flagellar basal body P-ring formation protein FlgA [Firmicutes bacterium]|nr:flagellar basal body P-ring formation protein FlgA [Bacillota bacterium]